MNNNNKEMAIISEEVNGIYLSYVNGEYGIYAHNEKPSNFASKSDPQVLYDNLLLTKYYDDLDNDNKLLIGIINSKLHDIGINPSTEILMELMEDLYELFFNTPDKQEVKRIITERVKGIDNEVTNKFQQQIDDLEKSKYLDIEKSIQGKLQNRKSGDVEMGRRELSEYLTIKYGAILRKNIGTLFIQDGYGFNKIQHDDLILELQKDFGSNFIHDDDLKKAIGYISDRREPQANIVKFKNTIYDMDKLRAIETEKPIFTLLQIDYDLNPNAESTLFKNFLNTSLKRDTLEETQRAVKGLLQLSGYFFTSGNKHRIIPILTGLTGAGKSTYLNIITHIFGNDKISGVSLQKLEKDNHASSQFIESHLNIIRDSDVGMIENNALLKNWTGNESFNVNPKYKPPIDLPPEEVPKPILSCNTMPVFKTYEDALISRFVILEFKISFSNSDKEITDLDKLIISNPSEIEWFIYESIKAYKEMMENKEKFIYRISKAETMELVEKHTHPLNHIIRELILKHDPEAYDIEKSLSEMVGEFRPIVTNDLADVILKYGEENAIDVPTDKKGKINKKQLINVIRHEYELTDGEMVDNGNGEYVKLREYKTRVDKWTDSKGGRHTDRVYPNLIATKTYWELLQEIEKERESEKQPTH